MSETPRKIPQKLSLRRLRRMQVQHRWKLEVVLSTALLMGCTESRESRPRAVSCQLRSCCLDATVGARARARGRAQQTASPRSTSRACFQPTSAYRCCGPRWRRNYTAPGSRPPAPAPCFRLQPCVDPPSPLVFDPECPSHPITQKLSRHPPSRYLLAQTLSRGAAHSTATIDLTEECHSLLLMMPR